MRFRGTRKGVWSPPCHRMTRLSASSSTRTTISSINADDPFAGCWRGARAVPGPLEISAEREQAIPVRGGQRRLGACCQCIPFILQRAHAQETLVPASLKFRRDEAVVRGGGIVLPPRTGGLVARPL